MPKSLESRAEDMARDVMRRSAVTRASSFGVGRLWASVEGGLVRSPAFTRLRPMERRSSSLV